MNWKRGEVQQSTGAPYLVVLTLLIVFYIIFLPPADREALLNGGKVSTTGGKVTYPNGTVIDDSLLKDFVFAGPGPLSKLTKTDYTHDISSFTLKGGSSAQVLTTENEFLVERSLFSSDKHTVEFSVADLSTISDPILLFNVKEGKGTLTITLNNKQIFSGSITQFNSDAIVLQKRLLSKTNYLTFEVSSPGLAFWSKNYYDIVDLHIQSTVSDKSSLSAEQSFEVRAVEVQRLMSARLRFVPDCIENVGKLNIILNGETIFSKIPDCGMLNTAAIPRSTLDNGINKIQFTAESGTYFLDRVQVNTFLDDDEGVTYYFELAEKLFLEKVESKPICGDIDNVCPSSCSATLDKDCCFAEFEDGFWCDVPTQLTNDRCVGFVDTFNINRCASGYKDESREVPENFPGICGDNEDGRCPTGCSKFYDQDCCFSQGGKYWCNDLTIGGVSNMCKTELSVDERGFCSSGYEAKTGSAGTAVLTRALDTEEVKLLTDYKVTVELIFVDDVKPHTAVLVINGFETNVDTTKDRITKDISKFVVDNSNYIQIIPKSDFSLVQVKVNVDKR